MNNQLLKLMLDHNLLNYVDGETPSQGYFLSFDLTKDDLLEYSNRLVELCASIAQDTQFSIEGPSKEVAYQRFLAAENIRIKLGLKSPSPIDSL